MKFAVDLPNFGPFSDPHLLMEIARETEAAGWDGFIIWDHLTRATRHDIIDPWIALAAAAVVTERVKIGAMVTPIPRRRPWKLARETVTLDHLSRGRLIMGVGLGGASGADVEWANFGEEMDLKIRAQMLDEGLAIVDGLWSGEPFSFAGSTTRSKRPVSRPHPTKNRAFLSGAVVTGLTNRPSGGLLVGTACCRSFQRMPTIYRSCASALSSP